MSRRANHLLVLAVALGALASVFFGLRTYGSYLLLRSAHEIGFAQASTLRAWMSLDYIATAFRVPADRLVSNLGLPPDTGRNESLKSIADRTGISRFDLVLRAQRALGQSVPARAPAAQPASGGLADAALAAALGYGYPALAAIFLLGALGAPLPTGIAAVLAGSLVGLGHLDWMPTAAVAVGASLAGDAAAYLVGRTAGDKFLARHGRWVGYSPDRGERVRALFARWGGLTVLLSRTLASHLSSVASLLAGIGAYSWPLFLVFSVAGRMAWTAAYLGLGYTIGPDVEAAAQFLGNLSGLLLALTALLACLVVRFGRPGERGVV